MIAVLGLRAPLIWARCSGGMGAGSVLTTRPSAMTCINWPSNRRVTCCPANCAASCRRGITFQRTKTWKEFTDPEGDAKLDRIEHVLEHFPDRLFAFDEFGPLGIRPTAGSCWAEQGRPDRVPATFHRTHGVTYFHGCYSV